MYPNYHASKNHTRERIDRVFKIDLIIHYHLPNLFLFHES